MWCKVNTINHGADPRESVLVTAPKDKRRVIMQPLNEVKRGWESIDWELTLCNGLSKGRSRFSTGSLGQDILPSVWLNWVGKRGMSAVRNIKLTPLLNGNKSSPYKRFSVDRRRRTSRCLQWVCLRLFLWFYSIFCVQALDCMCAPSLQNVIRVWHMGAVLKTAWCCISWRVTSYVRFFSRSLVCCLWQPLQHISVAWRWGRSATH